MIAQLQQRFGLDEGQVRGALGALLVYARNRLPKPQFDDLARSVPDAEYIMRDMRVRGIVTMPLDGIEDYQASLVKIGIAPSTAMLFAPAVVDCLGTSGFYVEQSILARVLD